jgi:hypothetical protein
MTEAQWLVSESPVALLAEFNADGYGRKLLLYTSALCALRPDLLTQHLHDWHAAVESVLRASEEPRSLDYWQEAAEDACLHRAGRGPPDERAYFSVLSHVVFCTWINDPQELDTPPPDVPEVLPLRRLGASLVRDIFGNPFGSISFSAVWRTDTAVILARQMYDSRDFSAMPILGDALQEVPSARREGFAGCDRAEILDHCRDACANHVRGCWVVDLVLDRE